MSSKSVNYNQLSMIASPKVQIIETPLPPDITAFLVGPIEEEQDYVELLNIIQQAAPGQEIVIRINSPGGNLNVCVAMVGAMKHSHANITTIIDGEACSAAAMIWLAGHTRAIASEYVTLMLHTASSFFGYQKMPHVRANIEVTEKIIESMMDELTIGVLTEEERSDIRKGVDVFLTGKEIIERIGVQEETTETTDETAE